MFRENPSLRPRLEPLLYQSLDATDIFLKILKERVLNISRIKIQSKEYWEIGTTAITASFQLYDAASVALDEVFKKRIDRLSRQKAVVVFFTMLMILVVSYLVTAFYLAMMETVNMLGHVSKRMVAGDTGGPIILTGVHDEMGRVIQSFNLVAEGLSASEKLLSSTLQALPVIVFCKDIKRNFQWTVWNKKAEEVFGIKAEECLGKTDYDFFPKEQADWF